MKASVHEPLEVNMYFRRMPSLTRGGLLGEGCEFRLILGEDELEGQLPKVGHGGWLVRDLICETNI